MDNRYPSKPSLPRPLLVALIVVAGFLIITGRLFYLQIVKGKEYKNLSDSNSVSEVLIPAPRGVIYDRNRKPLAKNNLRSSVFYIVSGDMGFDSENIDKLCAFLDIPLDKGKEIKKLAMDAETDTVVLVKEDIPKTKLIGLEERTSGFPRTIIETVPMRSYPYGRFSTHVIGYVGRISSSEY